MVGRDVYVLGGANSAGQAALYLARYARHVTLVVRADALGAGMSHYLVQQVEATPNIDVRLRTEVVGGGGDGSLEHLVLRDRADGGEEIVHADGALPHDRCATRTPSGCRAVSTGRAGLRAHRSGPAATASLAARAPTVPARDEHARCLRGRRCAAWLGQTGGIRGRRGLGRDPAPPRTVHSGPTAATRAYGLDTRRRRRGISYAGQQHSTSARQPRGRPRPLPQPGARRGPAHRGGPLRAHVPGPGPVGHRPAAADARGRRRRDLRRRRGPGPAEPPAATTPPRPPGGRSSAS